MGSNNNPRFGWDGGSPGMQAAGQIRSVLRLFFTVALFFLISPALFAAALHSPELRRKAVRFTARLLCASAGIHFLKRGSPPKPPFIFISNHLSWLDSVIFAAELGAVFVSQSRIASWPIIGIVLKMCGTVFIDRSSLKDIGRVNSGIGGALAKGDGVVFFPEADTSEGPGTKPFRPGLLEGPARSNIPVHWGTIGYRVPERWGPSSKRIAWTDWTPFPVHVFRALKSNRITACVYYSSNPVYSDNRKTLAKQLEQQVNQQLTQAITHGQP